MRVLRTTPGTAWVLDIPAGGNDKSGGAGDGDGRDGGSAGGGSGEVMLVVLMVVAVLLVETVVMAEVVVETAGMVRRGCTAARAHLPPTRRVCFFFFGQVASVPVSLLRFGCIATSEGGWEV